jgi:hypothetical protein
MRLELHVNFEHPGLPVGCMPGPRFDAIVPDGAWCGKRCFIVASGPTAKTVELSRLDGELTIAVNRALELFAPTIWFSADPRVVRWIESGALGAVARRRFHDSSSLKCVVVTSSDPYLAELPMLDRCHETLTATMARGLFTGAGLACNSGLGALNLALCLGADPIYLIGFDMKEGADGRRTWCEQDYPSIAEVVDLRTLTEAFVGVAALARARARIVNLNRDSALRCFEFGDFEQVLPPPGAADQSSR